MGNIASLLQLTDSHGSEGSGSSGSSSETSPMARLAHHNVPTKPAALATGCLPSFCDGSAAPPMLLVVNTADALIAVADEDDDLSTTGAPSSSGSPCYPSESSSSNLFRRSSSSSFFDDPLLYTDDELQLSSETCTFASDLSDDKDVWIVTTAALPWWTGTAINPLLRAAHLSQRNAPNRTTTLVIPWLEDAQDRLALYGEDWEDATCEQQEAFIRTRLKDEANLAYDGDDLAGDSPQPPHLQIQFYPARYHASLQSIFAMGDLCDRLVVRDPAHSICILEEPEHVNFYRAPGLVSWRSKFPHVVGVVHTNYKAYASQHMGGLVTAPLVGAMSSFMVRAYCDKVIKLSSVLQDYAVEKEVVCNVHGIRSVFLQAAPPTGNKVYFIGKMLWAKGLDKLLELQAYYKKKTGQYIAMSVYGSGPQLPEIQDAFLGRRPSKEESKSSYEALSKYYSYSTWGGFRQPLPVNFLGRKDHAALSSEYKIFINPSVTEVLCTATAEAVAMCKFVIIPDHPSNSFFSSFSNVLQYKSKTEFVQFVQYAQSHSPEPLSEALAYSLTWEAATERFLQAASVSERDAARRDRVGKKHDETIVRWHYKLGKGTTGDVLRKVMGAGPVADQFKYESQNSLNAMVTSEG